MFDTEVIQEIIQYKWITYGRSHHMMGLAMHFVYTFTLTLYVNEVYLVPDNEQQGIYTIMLGLGLLYPMSYEFR